MQTSIHKKGDKGNGQETSDKITRLIKQEKENVLRMAKKVDYSFLK